MHREGRKEALPGGNSPCLSILPSLYICSIFSMPSLYSQCVSLPTFNSFYHTHAFLLYSTTMYYTSDGEWVMPSYDVGRSMW